MFNKMVVQEALKRSRKVDYKPEWTPDYPADNRFEDIPSTPNETFKYFEQEDYLTSFMRFIRAFEEIIGLEKYRPGVIV